MIFHPQPVDDVALFLIHVTLGLLQQSAVHVEGAQPVEMVATGLVRVDRLQDQR